MINAKIKVSKEVAEAIEQLRKTMDDDKILYASTSPILDLGLFKRKEKPVVLTLREISPMILAASLVNGYEIEDTPQEIINARIKEINGTFVVFSDERRILDAEMRGIKLVVDAFNLKGVNA